MTPYRLGQLFVRVNRHHDAAVYDFARTLVIPDECVAAFLEATAELADRQTDTAPADSWLRIVEQAADMVGLEVAEPADGDQAGAPGPGQAALVGAEVSPDWNRAGHPSASRLYPDGRRRLGGQWPDRRPDRIKLAAEILGADERGHELRRRRGKILRIH